MKPLGEIKFVNRRLQFIREKYSESHINDRNVRNVVPKIGEFWSWLDNHGDISYFEVQDIRKAWEEEENERQE